MGETIKLEASDGHGFEGYLARPDGTAKGGLVVVQEIFGVNRHIRSVADGYAAEGYLAVAPALFDRRESQVELGYDETGFAKGRQLKSEVSWEIAIKDVAAAVDAVRPAGKVGTVGYCWGGSVAWLAACRNLVDAAVGYYGGQIHELNAETPGCPVLLHFGDRDAFIPPEHVKAIAEAHPEVEIHRYDAGHGFNCDERGDHDAACAATARQRSLAFLATHLG